MPEFAMHFPPDFKWGTATAAHQVEGNNTNNQCGNGNKRTNAS